MHLTRRQLMLGAVGATVAGAPACAPASESERNGFELTAPDIYLPTLHPSHDGLRVAQLSDIHIGIETPDVRIQFAVEEVNRANPDVIILTGDYTTFLREPIERIPFLLGGLRKPVFAVLGNHDHDVDAPMVRKALEQTGFTVLQNEFTQTRLKGATFNLFGVDDGLTKHADVPLTFKGAPADGTRLVLAHTPPTVRDLPPNADLACFSGHTHGGSVMIPGITNVVSRIWGQPYTRGHYTVNGNHLYVNRGLGFGNGRINAPRINSPPEVSVFTLRRAERQA
jgi:predicted MPP superfamily phosphohydrolase